MFSSLRSRTAVFMNEKRLNAAAVATTNLNIQTIIIMVQAYSLFLALLQLFAYEIGLDLIKRLGRENRTESWPRLAFVCVKPLGVVLSAHACVG